MNSIFHLPQEEKNKHELDRMDFEHLVETKAKRCNLDENLELVLYDIVDAIREKHILLIEASTEREDAYLIPLVLAYQKTSFFNSFVIATASPKARKKIMRKLEEISAFLEIDIPIHKLEDNENYVCLRKLNSYNRKKRGSIPSDPLPTTTTVSKETWQEIHVKNCTLTDCKFFETCKYVLDYNAFKKGCLFVPQTALVGNRMYLQRRDIFEKANLVLIDEASKLSTSVKHYHQHQIDYEHLSKYFLRTNQLLFKEETSVSTDNYLHSLHTFFENLSQYCGIKHWKPNEEFQTMAQKIAENTKNAHIHLTRRFSFQRMDRNVECLCEALFLAEQVFEDIANNSEKFDYRIQNKNPQNGGHPNFMEVTLRYTPQKVNDIIISSLKKLNGSIVLTDSDIAAKDNSYKRLCDECGIEEIAKESKKEIVKEYVLKQ